jgi:hypothetical protein
MRKKLTSLSFSVALLVLTSCSPRDYLTRRLAADLISASPSFKAPQQFILQTGVVSSKDSNSPEFAILQHHGWISASPTACPAAIAPPPCWDVLLTPSGVDTVRALISADDASRPSISIPVARREFVTVTGISKQGNVADVEFVWKLVPLNEIGAALHPGDLSFKSTVGFRDYDDGWRVVSTTPRPAQTLDEALKNSEPVQ